MRKLTREEARLIGQETAKILRDREYVTSGGRTVLLDARLLECVARTESYPPGAKLPTIPEGAWKTYIDVVNEPTLVAAGKLTNPVVLNFASGVNPGGGFLNGSQAQEEHIARSTALYECIRDNPMYTFHRRLDDAMCTNYAIYSPTYVIRDENEVLLEKPWPCAVITAPAPNVASLRWQAPDRMVEVPQTFAERIEKVLTIAAIHGHKDIVLGAWGCGVYANSPEYVANRFWHALNSEFKGVFERVVFAILDQSAAQHCITPFAAVFAK